MATRDPEQVVIGGLVATYHAASAGGDKFKPAANRFLHVKNGSAGSINVTVTTPNTVAGQAIGDAVVAVGAGAEEFIGPFPAEHFAGSDGLASVAWSAVTTVTFAVVQV